MRLRRSVARVRYVSNRFLYMTRLYHHRLLSHRRPVDRGAAVSAGAGVAVGTALVIAVLASGVFGAAVATNSTLTGDARIVTAAGASGGRAVLFASGAGSSTPVPTPLPTPAPTPVKTAICTVSGATGAGTPAYVVNVGAPVAGGGNSVTEIQNAVNAASSHAGGGEVVLAPGTYTLTQSIDLGSNVLLTGAGEGGTTLIASSGANVDPMVTTNGSSNDTVQSLTVNQNGSSSASHQNLSSYLIEDRGGKNVIFQNVATRDPSTYSMVAVGASNFCFRNNNVEQDPTENGKYNQLDGIHVLESSFGDVLDNYVDQRFDGATDGDDGLVAHSITAPTHDITYAGNVVRGGSNGNDMQIALGDEIYNIKIIGNEFYGGPFGIRTGIYSSGTNNVSNITISGNNIHNNTPGNAYVNGGEAVDIGGSEAGGGLKGATNILIENNVTCSATDNGTDGAFSVIAGSGNVDSGNSTYSGCSDTATTSVPPPTIP